jgi:hypothetical protein
MVISYLGTYWQVYEMMVDGVRGENVKLWLLFLFRLAETRKAAPTARDFICLQQVVKYFSFSRSR